MMVDDVTVEVEGWYLKFINLGKLLYSKIGFTKGEVIDYYIRVVFVLLFYFVDWLLIVKCYLNGVDVQFFFEKNASWGMPSWVRTETVVVLGFIKNWEMIDFVVVDILFMLVRFVNLVAVELHVL